MLRSTAAKVSKNAFSRTFASEVNTASNRGPAFSLSEDQQSFQELARDFTLNEIIPVAAELDISMAYPWEVIKKAHAAGLMNSEFHSALCELLLMKFSSYSRSCKSIHLRSKSLGADILQFGGSGLDLMSGALISEELAFGCTGIQTGWLLNSESCTKADDFDSYRS